MQLLFLKKGFLSQSKRERYILWNLFNLWWLIFVNCGVLWGCNFVDASVFYFSKKITLLNLFSSRRVTHNDSTVIFSGNIRVLKCLLNIKPHLGFQYLILWRAIREFHSIKLFWNIHEDLSQTFLWKCSVAIHVFH